jgi:hypothetical protein
MKAIYEQKGYSKDWIDKRLRGIAIRQNLRQHLLISFFHQRRAFSNGYNL